MEVISKSINEGIKKLNDTIEVYNKLSKNVQDYHDSLKTMLTLTGETQDIKYKNSIDKLDAINSRINYVKLIINELNKIDIFVKKEHVSDLTNGCMYYGSRILYYSDEFLNLSSEEMFNSILNHIFYYTGCLYMITNNEIRLSYIITGFMLCYGKKINYSLGRDIYKTYKDKINIKVNNTNNNYKDFVMRNKELMPFMLKDKSDKNNDVFRTYRIIFGNQIVEMPMKLKIVNNDEIYIQNLGGKNVV